MVSTALHGKKLIQYLLLYSLSLSTNRVVVESSSSSSSSLARVVVNDLIILYR